MLIQTIVQCAVGIFFFMSLFFLIARFIKKDTIVDVAWGMGFLFITLFSLIKNGFYYFPQIITTVLVTFWAFRLSGYLFLRTYGKKEDTRYQELKATWGKWTMLYSYIFIYVLQGGLIILIGYPLILITATDSQGSIPATFIGVAIWLTGFLFETIADLQIYQFMFKPENKGKIMRVGLWRYSRHPNYFGEMLVWWGFFFIALGIPLGWSSIISPIIITFLLLFVSGVPLAEKQISKLDEFQEYKESTSVLIPWFETNKKDDNATN